jgi:hypothetical protein
MKNLILSVSLFGLLLSACGPQAPTETYSLVRTCNPPSFRRPAQYIYKRDSDGKLFYGTRTPYGLQALVSDVDLDDICLKLKPKKMAIPGLF